MRFITLTAVGLMLYFNSFATPSNEAVTKIRYRYSEIQSKLKKQDYVVKNLSENQSNSVVVAYLKNNKIELIVSEMYGASGKIRHEYYFGKNGELILASNQLFNYDVDENQVEKMVKVSENKYFYQAKKLVRWVENGKIVKMSHPDAKPRSRYMLGNSLAFSQQLKQNDQIISKHQQNSYSAEFSRGQRAECSAGCD